MKSFAAIALFAAASQAVLIQRRGDDRWMQRGWRRDEWAGPWDNEARAAAFKVREGGRTVGAGQVTEIIEANGGDKDRPRAVFPSQAARKAELVSMDAEIDDYQQKFDSTRPDNVRPDGH